MEYVNLEDFSVFRLGVSLLIFGIIIFLYHFYPIRFLKAIRKHHRKIIFAFFLLYLVDVLFRFSCPSCLNNPIIQDDYALHFADGLTSSFFFKASSRIWGYDPYYFAGYPSGIFLAIDNHWVFLFHVILGGFFNSGFGFNLSIFFSFLTLPVLILLTAKNFKMREINTLIFFILSMSLINGFPEIKGFYESGLYAFILATYLSFYIMSLFYKYLYQKNLLNLIKITLFGSLAFFIHPLSSIICLGLGLPFFVFYFNRLTLRDIGRFTTSTVVVFVLNLPWITPLRRFSYLITPHGWGVYLETYPDLVLDIITSNPPFVVLLVLFLLYLLKSHRRNRRFTRSLFVSFVLFFTLSFFGSQIGLWDFEPARFICPLILVLVFSVSQIFKFQLIKRNIPFLVLYGVCVILLLGHPPKKFTCGYQKYPEAGKILEFIRTNLSNKARIHVQDSDKHPYFLSHFTAMIPYLTSRKILAGPYILPPTRFRFSQFIDEHIFGRNLNKLSLPKFRKYLKLYNIKYFLIFSQKASNFFNTYQNFKKIFNAGRFVIYEYLDSDENFCYGSDAEVKADYDKIIVKNATSSVTILKYHYIPTLRIIPKTLKMNPIKLLEDPVPFIKVKNGSCSNFVIYNK